MHMVIKRLCIKGTLAGTMQDTAAALDYAHRGLLRPIHEVRGISDWRRAFSNSSVVRSLVG